MDMGASLPRHEIRKRRVGSQSRFLNKQSARRWYRVTQNLMEALVVEKCRVCVRCGILRLL